MITASRFKPAWWLTNAHAQTLFSPFRSQEPAVIDKTEQIELPDGDFIELAWSTKDLSPETPIIVILHGLTGGLSSCYVPRFMKAFNQQGWRAVLLHFRGSGPHVNRLPRSYHSGDTADLDFFMRLLNQREPSSKKVVVGISMGGNILLKWLGEKKITKIIDAAVAISVPFVLGRVSDRMNRGLSRMYQKRLLHCLKTFFAARSSYFKPVPEPFKKAEFCRCFWTFDHEVTAPLNGFSSVHDYYRQSSCRPFLPFILVPTLIIHAEDDPFMTKDVIPTADELPTLVTLELSKKGGHVGFVASSRLGRPVYWLDKRLVEFINQKVATKYDFPKD